MHQNYRLTENVDSWSLEELFWLDTLLLPKGEYKLVCPYGVPTKKKEHSLNEMEHWGIT